MRPTERVFIIYVIPTQAGILQRSGHSRPDAAHLTSVRRIVEYSAGEIRTPVPIGVQYTLACFIGPSHTPGIMPEQVELIVDDAPDFDINITQITQTHLV